jgi:hypothetical protein
MSTLFSLYCLNLTQLSILSVRMVTAGSVLQCYSVREKFQLDVVAHHRHTLGFCVLASIVARFTAAAWLHLCMCALCVLFQHFIDCFPASPSRLKWEYICKLSFISADSILLALSESLQSAVHMMVSAVVINLASTTIYQ